MDISKKTEDGTLTITVRGRLDTNTAPQLESALPQDWTKAVVFDFGGLEYISSAGLRVLICAQKAAGAAGGRIKVANPNAMVKGVLDMTGCSTLFDIV